MCAKQPQRQPGQPGAAAAAGVALTVACWPTGYSLGLALDESALASSLFLSPPDVDEAGLPVELDAVDEWAA